MRLAVVFLASLFVTPYAFGQSVPSQFSNLISCTGVYNASNCAVLNSPNDAKPALYDGTSGTVYTDAVFGTKIKRFTTPAGRTGSGDPWVVNYSPQEPWNADGSKFLIQGPAGYFYLFDGNTYALIRQMTNFCYDYTNPSPHWDAKDPDKLWYTCYNKVEYYRPSTDTSTVVKAFTTPIAGVDPTTNVILTKDYCNMADDTDHVSYLIIRPNDGASLAMFTYQISTDTISASQSFVSGPLATPGGPLTKIPATACTSPGGKYVYVEWNCTPGSSCPAGHHGVEVFDFATLSKKFELGPSGGVYDNVVHSDSGWDLAGNEVYFSQLRDVTTPDYTTFSSFNLATGAETDYILPHSFFGDGGGCGGCVNVYHFSLRGTRGQPGYALISTFTQGNDSWADPEPGSTPMAAELFALKLDTGGSGCASGVACGTSTVYRIAHDQTIRHSDDYYGEPHAVPNSNFTKIAFNSTWRNTSYACSPTCPADLNQAYVAELGTPSGGPPATKPNPPPNLRVIVQ